MKAGSEVCFSEPQKNKDWFQLVSWFMC